MARISFLIGTKTLPPSGRAIPATVGLAGRPAVPNSMSQTLPSLEGLDAVLESLAADPRMPPNFPDWIRDTIKNGGGKIRVMRYILDHAPPGGAPLRVLDVGAQ